MKLLSKTALIGGLLAVLTFTAPAAPFDIFLKLPGIPGESNSETHLGEIDVVNFRTSVLEKGTGTVGSGAGVGKPDFRPLTIYKQIDKSSPVLFLTCATGRHLPKATLSVDRIGDFNFTFFTIVLTDVLVSSINDASETTDNEGNLLETITLDYSKIEWTFIPQNSDGTPGTPVKGGFDVKNNKKL
jgi:type VI secretion system secreted protein Hcp